MYMMTPCTALKVFIILSYVNRKITGELKMEKTATAWHWQFGSRYRSSKKTTFQQGKVRLQSCDSADITIFFPWGN